MPIQIKRPAPTVIQDSLPLPPSFPDLPDEILQRFPSLVNWETDTGAWYKKLSSAIQDGNRTISQTSTKATVKTDLLGVRITIETEERETADGWLSGKYTLQVIAGDVVTGMEITSATGPNAGTVSDVTFQADRFMIYSGTAKKLIFQADALQNKVRMAGVFTVDGASNSIYVKTTAGAGTYNDAATPFFVDNNSFFSLADKLTWNPTTATLTITGSITATAGSIGGFNIGADYIRDVANSMGLASTATGGDDVRFWAGATFANRGTAPFRVTEAGVLTASSGTFSGSITGASGTFSGSLSSTSGSIGGFDIGSDYIRDSVNSFGLASTVTGGDDVRFWAGDTYANRATAPFHVTEGGVLTLNSSSASITIGSGLITSSGFRFGSGSGARVSLENDDTGVYGIVLRNSASTIVGVYSVRSGANEDGYVFLKKSDASLDVYLRYDGLVFSSDTNLRRASANFLATDDSFYVGGDFFVGKGAVDTTNVGIYATASGVFASVTNGGGTSTFVRLGSDGAIINFSRDGSSVVGDISVTTTTTTYNTSSDRRLKRNFVSGWSLGDDFDRIEIGEFEWKINGLRGRGVLAQDLFEVFPDAVKRGDDDTAWAQHLWSVDYGRLTIPLIAEVKALRVRVRELEARA